MQFVQFFLVVLLGMLFLVTADPLSIDGYAYHGCYNETTEVSDSGVRALNGGKSQALHDAMTIETCIGYCDEDDFKFAGLEYGSECWCSNRISDLSTKLEEETCDIPCAGNRTQTCGGSLKLNVYTTENANGANPTSPRSAASLIAMTALAAYLLL